MDIALNRMILKKINKIQDHLLTNNQDTWMSIKDAVQYTKLSDSTIRRAIKKGFYYLNWVRKKKLERWVYSPTPKAGGIS